ncbi:type III polyketide synthase [Rhodocytophaga rosea]|uniref:Type III polyketide synthase n=1 Tax=Rhodocytophaga rosea TaxID=2704465 RepID=A0A6C0GK48_9BACT|nr:type III polyketide synthase [Rhodocytophaga rosea]QHT68194.1 type III polyketide synthase [Rhodocytophaga rosea]
MKSYISAIGTANPPYKLPQMRIADFMAEAVSMNAAEKKKLTALYRSTGIQYRYTVLADYTRRNGAFDFYSNTPDLEPFPTIDRRMQLYKQHAVPLCTEAIRNCLLAYPDFSPTQITHLITVSCTGMYAPGIDIELVETIGLATNIQRTAINFMGCYAAFNALKTADAICKSNPEAKVLVVCVELCTIHFQKYKTEDHLLSNAIFADGAAAVIMEASPRNEYSISIESLYCDLHFDGKNDMAWHIGNFGFEMTLSSYIPDLIKNGIRQLTERLLKHLKLTTHDIHLFAIHPGGKRILEVIEQQLGLCKEDNRYAYQTLKAYGNMSSPTILFVLKALWNDLQQSDAGKNILSFAFGPGLTLESMLLKVHYR